MKKIINNTWYYVFNIIIIIFALISIWILFSTIEISLNNIQSPKYSTFNLFVLSQDYKRQIENDTDIINEDIYDGNELVNC